MKSRLNQYLITGKPVSLKWFSGKLALGITIVLILLSAEQKAQAQVLATGHAFAEIVEPTALSAEANNHHFISESDINLNDELLLAEVKLSGRDVNIDVSVQSENLVAADGRTLLFNATACPGCSSNNSNPMSGEKLFTLTGTPGATTSTGKSNTFNGQYRVTFMYN